MEPLHGGQQVLRTASSVNSLIFMVQSIGFTPYAYVERAFLPRLKAADFLSALVNLPYILPQIKTVHSLFDTKNSGTKCATVFIHTTYNFI
jgi:hypothetical protein